MHKLTKPIIFFDLETTGTSTTQDRIVQIAATKVDPQNEAGWEMKKMLINPGMPIPPGATKVHGITDEMVQDKPPFAAYAKSFYEYIKGCNFAGFNIRTFDVPLLAEEFARLPIAYPFPDPDTKYFDSCRIFHNQEPRNLEAAYKFYTGKTLQGAHDAAVDVAATVEVFQAQVLRYPEIMEMDETQLDLFCMDGVRSLDLAGKIIMNENNEPVYSFGKSKGKRVVDDAGFGLWMLKNDFNTDTKNVLKKILK